MSDKIIIFSGKQFSGKDTVAKIFLENMPTYRRCAMGDIIKIEYGRQHNLTYEEIEKNKSTYRQGLIDLGNQGRAKSPDYWIKKIICEDGHIIVTDVRVKHELNTFKNAGAITIRVNASKDVRASRGTLIGENDVTEIDLDDINDWDFVIENNKDYESLKNKALEIIKQIKD
jgi:phosphomevalonate kinase